MLCCTRGLLRITSWVDRLRQHIVYALPSKSISEKNPKKIVKCTCKHLNTYLNCNKILIFLPSECVLTDGSAFTSARFQELPLILIGEKTSNRKILVDVDCSVVDVRDVRALLLLHFRLYVEWIHGKEHEPRTRLSEHKSALA